MKILSPLFSLTLFMAALLSFSVQPIFGKMMLPMIGGAPAGWIVAMAFFQLALLGGYGVSYVLGRFNPWIHAAGLLLLYGIGYTFLPPHMPALPDSVQGEALSFAVIQALARSVLFPFLALTATTAALQRVFSATAHPTARDPYYLFVASNIGSFVGLFAYPLLLEPFFGLHDQTHFWQGVYAFLIVAIIASCGFAWLYRNRVAEQEIGTSEIVMPVTGRQIFSWLILAFLPCSLSMGVTSVITDDVGGLPLFWVIPLGLYLLTFILAFGKRQLISHKTLENFHVIGVIFLITVLSLGIGYWPNGDIGTFLLMGSMLLAIFFFIALSSHRKLAERRPRIQHLTLYYFIVALGGGLAGILHAFVLPFVLPYAIEFSIAAILSLLLIPDRFHEQFDRPHLRPYVRFFKPAFVVGLVMLLITTMLQLLDLSKLIILIPGTIFVLIAMLMSVRPRYLLALGVCTLLCSSLVYHPGKLLYRTRNFFGSIAVADLATSDLAMRIFMHGNTLHGMQVIENKHPDRPLDVGYYGKNGPIKDALAVTKARDWAIVGLGAGVLACFDTNLTTDFYEIDSDVERVARQYFTYLKDCPPKQVVIGDGRLKIAHSNKKYDVILIDAFNSDGIPIHLVTVDALRMFMEHLNPNGVILYHISNRYLNLSFPLAAIAKAADRHAYFKRHISAEGKEEALSVFSQWMVIPSTDEMGTEMLAKGWREIVTDRVPWTDDKSSLVEAVINPWRKSR